MSQPLAQVLGDLEIPRGPDLAFSTDVPERFYRAGTVLRVRLPERLVCAECQGGGCDRCGRKGAIRLREEHEAAEWLDVTLPQSLNANKIQIRIPHQGGEPLDAQSDELPRGHLHLTLTKSDQESDVVLLGKPAPISDAERRRLAKKSLLVVGSLILLFIFLLRLSGWV